MPNEELVTTTDQSRDLQDQFVLSDSQAGYTPQRPSSSHPGPLIGFDFVNEQHPDVRATGPSNFIRPTFTQSEQGFLTQTVFRDNTIINPSFTGPQVIDFNPIQSAIQAQNQAPSQTQVVPNLTSVPTVLDSEATSPADDVSVVQQSGVATPALPSFEPCYVRTCNNLITVRDDFTYRQANEYVQEEEYLNEIDIPIKRNRVVIIFIAKKIETYFNN